MPLSIPAFDQYQQPMFPLRGLWNSIPPEGDKFVNAEIDWLVTTKSSAVQFSLSGNSPVSLSQIVALSVDNSRSGADVDFIFPDSGFVLTVPAHNQLVAPVFTNALMFYASAPAALAGDVTVFQILNSMPPPVPIAPSVQQNTGKVVGGPVTNSTTPLVPAGVNGTLNTISISIGASATGTCDIELVDGTGKLLWASTFTAPENAFVNLTGLAIRFQNGINLVIAFSTMTAGATTATAYYSTP